MSLNILYSYYMVREIHQAQIFFHFYFYLLPFTKFQIAIARDRDTSHRYHATVHDTVSQFSYRYEVSNIKLLLLSSH